jgi:cation transport ATPase
MQKKRKAIEKKLNSELKELRKIREAEAEADIIPKDGARKTVPELDLEYLNIRKQEKEEEKEEEKEFDDENKGYVEIKVAEESEEKHKSHEEHHKEHHAHEHRKTPSFYLFSIFILALLNLLVQSLSDSLPIIIFYVGLGIFLLWSALNLVLFFVFIAKRYERVSVILPFYFVLKFIVFSFLSIAAPQNLGPAIIMVASLFESLFAFILWKR